MTPDEAIELLTLIAGYYPSMRAIDETAPVWHAALADVPYRAALDAVNRYCRTETRFIQVADVRRVVAEMAGILPPSTDVGYAQAMQFNGWLDHQNVDTRPDIHPAVETAGRSAGWNNLRDSSPWESRRLFAAAYEHRAEQVRRGVLTGDLTEQIAAARRRAVRAGG